MDIIFILEWQTACVKFITFSDHETFENIGSSRSNSNMLQVLVVMETGSVPIQNAGTQISHGVLSAIAVIKNGLKGWEVLNHPVS